MRLAIPFPFGEVEVNVRKSRRARPLFWYSVLSAALHFAWIAIVGVLLMRTFVPLSTQKQQQPMIVTISSAPKIQSRPRAVVAHRPIVRPEPVQRPVPREAVQRRIARPISRPRHELSKPARVAYASQNSQQLTQAQLQEQTRIYQQTIARAKAASDPVSGAADSTLTPAATKRSAMNLQGQFAKPQPEGVLYPSKRWVDGAYVYYYVTYTAVYADGSSESGVVPWPIRFPLGDDPFARGIHRMPLPGPLPDYVLPSGVAMEPLVKNCFDHHYEYCPIEHE
jgi:hypothetical protein